MSLGVVCKPTSVTVEENSFFTCEKLPTGGSFWDRSRSLFPIPTSVCSIPIQVLYALLHLCQSCDVFLEILVLLAFSIQLILTVFVVPVLHSLLSLAWKGFMKTSYLELGVPRFLILCSLPSCWFLYLFPPAIGCPSTFHTCRYKILSSISHTRNFIMYRFSNWSKVVYYYLWRLFEVSWFNNMYHLSVLRNLYYGP